jgi:ferritin-like metal-binding protein YciE
MDMGLFSKDIKTFDDLFAHGLKDLFYAENEIVEALPKMIDKAVNRDLKTDLKLHLRETQEQVKRLQQVFKLRGEEPQGVRCIAIDGLLKEGDTVLGEIDNETVMDAAIIAAAQAVEHYEIARYGALIAWAMEMGRGDMARILKRTLEEEKATDEKLTALAEARIKPVAKGSRRPAVRRRSSHTVRTAPSHRASARTKKSKVGKRGAARRSR